MSQAFMRALSILPGTMIVDPLLGLSDAVDVLDVLDVLDDLGDLDDLDDVGDLVLGDFDDLDDLEPAERLPAPNDSSVV